MRLLELHLKAYGPFAGQRIDLSKGSFGLHLVYGPNEAGKSSSLRAIHDFLYGIPSRTTDNFRFAYPQLRIGAVLQAANGKRLAAIRRKANSKSLRADDDQAVVEQAELEALLHGVDAEMFRTMFGIDHQRLREGGDQIVKGKGELGEVLFAAGAGLIGLRRTRQHLQNELESLLSESGRKGVIYHQLEKYRDLEQQITAAQVKVSDWLRVTDGLTQAQTELEHLKSNQQEKLAQSSRLERINNALPIYSSWQQLSKRIETLSNVPNLPADFSNSAQQELSLLAQLETEAKIKQQQIESNRRQRQDLQPNHELLALADSIEALKERLVGYEQAGLDGPVLAKDLQLAEQTLAARLRELDCHTDLFALEDLHVAPDQAIRIDELGRRHESLREQLQRLVDQQARQHQQRQALQDRQASLPNSERLTQLKNIRQAVRDEGSLETRWRDVNREYTKLSDEIELALRRLSNWQGNWEQMESLPLPSVDQIKLFQQRAEQIDRQQEKLTTAIEQTTADQANQQSELDELELDGQIPSIDHLQSVRQQRDAAAALIRQQWNEYQTGSLTAESLRAEEAFLEQLKSHDALDRSWQLLSAQADNLADQLYQEADGVARKSKLSLQLQRGQDELRQLHHEQETLNRKKAQWDQEWLNLWQPANVSPQTPAEMVTWLNRLEKIQDRIGLMREKESHLRQIEDRMNYQCQLIHSELKTKLEPDSVLPISADQVPVKLKEPFFLNLPLWRATLEQICDQLQDTAGEKKQLMNSLQQLEQEIKINQTQQTTTQLEFEKTGLEWAEEMLGLKLDSKALPKQALARVEMIRETIAQQTETQRLVGQVNRNETRMAQFESEALALIETFLIDWQNIQSRGIVVGFRLLATELAQHQSALRDSQRLDSEHVDFLLQQQQTNGGIQRHENNIANLMKQAGIEDRQELVEIGRLSCQKVELNERRDDVECQLLGLASGQSLEVFIQQLENEQPESDTLKYRCEQLKQESGEIDQQIMQIVGRIKTLELEQQQFDQAAGAVGLNADRAALAAEMEQSVQQYLVLKVAAAAMNRGIERYRQKNQLPVLTRASQLFHQMTLGRYISLKADYDENGQPHLVAVRQNGAPRRGQPIELFPCDQSADDSSPSSFGNLDYDNLEEVGVTAMSDGTCDQLFLALRLASLENWLDHHDEPLPLIVDDILLNFDDDRSRATLKAMAELSQKTQIIFFTHHQRLVELARQSLPPQKLFVTDLSQIEPT